MKKQKIKQGWGTELYWKKLKMEATDHDMSIIQYTDKLANDEESIYQQLRGKKKTDESFKFF